jgi:hypothetical protein
VVSPRVAGTIILLAIAVTVVPQEQTGVTTSYDGAYVVLSADAGTGVSPVVTRVVSSAAQEHLELLGIVVFEETDAYRYSNLEPDFLLTMLITPVGEGVVVDYGLFLYGSTTPLTELQYEQAVGLNLDRAVADSINSLLGESASFIAAAAAERRRNPVELIIAPTESETTDSETEGDSDETEEIAAVDDSMPRVEIAAGVAPLFPVGSSSQYFDIAYGADLRIAVMFGQQRRAAAGVVTRALFSIAEGVAADADLLFVPIGAEIRLIDRAFLSPAAYLSAGASILRAASPVLGTFVKIIPYASGGVGVKFRLFPGLGVAAQVDFSAFFEGSTVILGFAPSITVNMEL